MTLFFLALRKSKHSLSHVNIQLRLTQCKMSIHEWLFIRHMLAALRLRFKGGGGRGQGGGRKGGVEEGVTKFMAMSPILSLPKGVPIKCC